jgi:uncharacterized membrane protein
MNPIQQVQGRYVSRNLNRLHDEHTTFGDQLADGLARFGGSWTFLILFGGALALWVGVNSLQLLIAPFDPYPFIFLNLVLSCLAAIQAPIIMMSQNRQASRDRLAAELDYTCNLKSEREVEQLHEKLDLLREKQWMDLVELQQHQITLLNQLLDRQSQLLGQRASPALTPPKEDGGGTASASIFRAREWPRPDGSTSADALSWFDAGAELRQWATSSLILGAAALGRRVSTMLNRM